MLLPGALLLVSTCGAGRVTRQTTARDAVKGDTFTEIGAVIKDANKFHVKWRTCCIGLSFGELGRISYLVMIHVIYDL